MESRQKHTMSIVGGVILIILGLLALMPLPSFGFTFWRDFWPLIIIGVGLLFFVGLIIGGKAASGLAIPGSIVTTVGGILFVQNLTNHWESWSFAWTIIVISAGVGMFIMGQYGGNEGQRQAGLRTIQVGVVMFVIFGAFFSIIFRYFGISKAVFPAALILLGIYLLVTRMGLLPASTGGRTANESKIEG